MFAVIAYWLLFVVMCWLFIGRLRCDNENNFYVGVQKIADLTSDPNRESLWYLEVIDAKTRFYNSDTNNGPRRVGMNNTNYLSAINNTNKDNGKDTNRSYVANKRIKEVVEIKSE